MWQTFQRSYLYEKLFQIVFFSRLEGCGSKLNPLKQMNVGAAFNKDQYIEFLQFCKKNNLTKYKVVKLAVISYCKIQSPDHQTGRMRTNVDEELEELLKK